MQYYLSCRRNAFGASTQLAKDLLIDLETVEVSIETQGLKDLVEAMDSLHPRLPYLFKGKK
jgi:hypothetical protein